MRRLALLLFGIVAAGFVPGSRGEATPDAWTPAALSTAEYESTPTFSADGRELMFMRADRSFSNWRLLVSRCENGRWSRPAPPSFAAAAPVIEADPGYTPDGKGLYFVSARHDPANADFDIWYVERRRDGGWGEPERLPSPVNSPEAELLPRADRDGRVYFGSGRPGGHGASDIYVAERERPGVWKVRNVGPPVSTAANEYEAEVSRDGRTLIVVADRGDRSHLYRFERAPSGWVETGRIRASQDVFQVGPLLSPDAEALLFAQSEGDRSGEIFRVSLTTKGSPSWPRPCGAGSR